jgi:DNA-directed RNA polymerase specialized sigma24 family protein
MPTCRDISQEMWTQAVQVLIVFFRHHGVTDADDLAQETLLRILQRNDSFPFEKEEDFPKVCYGFARNVLLENRRKIRRNAWDLLDPDMPAPQHQFGGARATEDRIFLEEVWNIGQTQLKKKEWEAIQQGAEDDRTTMPDRLNMGTANNVRVQLHRARRKLARIIRLGKRDV